jgi:rhodanese-related sulfurtransferase
MAAKAPLSALFGLLLVVAASAAPGATRLVSSGVAPEALRQRLEASDPLLLIDVRSPDEYSSGHIPGAVSIPAPTLVRHLDEIRQARDPVLYCNDTRLTRFSEQLLAQKGVTGFAHLEGGLDAWTAEGLPMENSLPETDR